MSRHYVSYEAQCPFYQCEDKTVIYCEGLIPGSSIHLAFSGSATKKADYHKATHCCSNWEACRIAKMLAAKYE